MQTTPPSIRKYHNSSIHSSHLNSRFVKTVGTEPPVESIREWTGIMGFSDDSHPYVGNTPDEPRKWVIGGFHGHGMVRIFLCAKALVQQILSQDSSRKTPWPNWMPRGYIYHPNRFPIDEIKHYYYLIQPKQHTI